MTQSAPRPRTAQRVALIAGSLVGVLSFVGPDAGGRYGLLCRCRGSVRRVAGFAGRCESVADHPERPARGGGGSSVQGHYLRGLVSLGVRLAGPRGGGRVIVSQPWFLNSYYSDRFSIRYVRYSIYLRRNHAVDGLEEQYVAERSEQLRRASGLTRRDLVALGAAGTLAAGLGGFLRPCFGGRSDCGYVADREAAPAGMVHHPRHQRRDAVGQRERSRLHDAERAVLRPQPHRHAADRRDCLAAPCLRLGARRRRRHVHLRAAPAAAEPGADGVHRVRRERQELLRDHSRALPRPGRSGRSVRSASRDGAVSS